MNNIERIIAILDCTTHEEIRVALRAAMIDYDKSLSVSDLAANIARRRLSIIEKLQETIALDARQPRGMRR